MLRFSKKVEYALMALKHIAFTNNVVTAKEISNKYNIPYELLAKILQKLKKEEILISTQGMNGGYSLNKKASEISLHNIVTVFEGNVAITECQNGNKACSCSMHDSCSIKNPIEMIQKDIEKLFMRKTISDFV
ncbi:Rrf2 family transcriptional regulator [soil metagenome]